MSDGAATPAPPPQQHIDPLVQLGSDSHTVQRLHHATPEHLHLTTRRCFIGPIPQGWLNSHRREWYKHHLGIHYSSRAATFTAAPEFGRHRRLTGLEGPSVSASYRHSFPRPPSLDDEEERRRGGNGEQQDEFDDEEDDLDALQRADTHPDAAPGSLATNAVPPAIRVPRAETDDQSDSDHEADLRELAHAEPIATHADVTPEVGNTPRGQSPARPDAASLGPATASVASDETIRPGTSQREIVSESNDKPSTPPARAQPEQDSTRLSPVATKSKPRPIKNQSDSSASQSPLWLSAPTSQSSDSRRSNSSRPRHSRSASGSSFVTANEDVPQTPSRLSVVDEGASNGGMPYRTSGVSDVSAGVNGGSRGTSTRSLIPQSQKDGAADSASPDAATTASASQQEASNQDPDGLKPVQTTSKASSVAKSEPQLSRVQPGLVRFNIPEDTSSRQQLVKVRLAQIRKRDTLRPFRRGKVHDGQIVKMEKMLVRVDLTAHEVPPDFSETLGEKIETTVVEKWKEFMVVCRESDDDDAHFVLQLYRSRVIPALEKARVKKRWTYEVQLRRSNCKINLFSSLDKTMVLWHPSRRGTKIYTLQARSGANSMEWYTFLRNALGSTRTSVLSIGVPDLGVNLRLDKPFAQLESTKDVEDAADGDEQALLRTIKEEQAASVNIIKRCLEMLEQSPEWDSILSSWNGAQRMGLAWKRYDRLEWVHGANEKKMYGTMAMETSHELELRPKQHYPTSVLGKAGSITEPPPVEGFLIRLTSQRGVDKKLGRLFFKRLYFSTHNHYLVFNRPAKADPPPPPKMPMTEQAEIPDSEQIAQKIPLIYSINPFPLSEEKGLEWLGTEAHPQHTERDRDAFDEAERKTRIMLNCDGVIDLCTVETVRNVQRGSTPADDNLDSGENVDFNVHVTDSTADDGTTNDMDDGRAFELVMKNGLVVRLQAFNRSTQKEWKWRLSALVDYWKQRTASDSALYKQTRARNMERLRIDEATEATVGRAAAKWETADSYASAELYNMCGISCCRTIHMSGLLYRKPRMHGAFTRYLTMLVHGKLLMFDDVARDREGRPQPQVHHSRALTLDLRDCYVYSGLLTGNNLLYQSAGHDPRNHGRHALPRIYGADGWTSSDEDTATAFVVWHGKHSGWFRSQGVDGHTGGRGRQQLKRVRALGSEGRSVVFRTRSRAERDLWVMSIAMEIERFWKGEDVRIEG